MLGEAKNSSTNHLNNSNEASIDFIDIQYKKSYEIAEKQCIETLLNCFYRETLNSGKYIQILSLNELKKHYKELPVILETDNNFFMILSLPETERKIIIAIKYPSKIGLCHYKSMPYIQKEISSWQEVTWKELAIYLLKELSIQYHQPFNYELLEQIKNSIQVMSTVINYHLQSIRKETTNISFIESEQSLIFGHTFHPAPKSREGLTPKDIYEFSPELNANFSLHYFLVKKEHLIHESLTDKSATDIIRENSPRHLYIKDNYVLVCTHPWQALHLKKLPSVKEAIKRGYIYDIGKHGKKYYATSSIRTVYHPDNDFFYKFSLNIRITNCVRKNSIYELKTAVFLSKILQSKLIEIKNKFPNFELMLETAFLTVDLPTSSEEERKQITEGFGVIFRQSFSKEQFKAYTPTLAGTLFSKDLSGRSFIFHHINHLSKDLKIDYKNVAVKWFEQYIEKLLYPLLYCHFNLGITFEPHLQNVLVGINNHLPSHIFIRDMEGTKLSTEFWDEELLTDLDDKEKKSLYYSEQLAWNRITYCLLVNNIGEAIFHIANGSEHLEEILWNCVKKHLKNFLENYGNEHAKKRISGLLSNEPLPIKGNLTTRFLKKADKEALYYYLTEHPLQTVIKTEPKLSKTQIEKNTIKRLLQACVCEELLTYTIKGNKLHIFLEKSNKTIILNKVQFFNLNKFKVEGEIILSSKEKFETLEDVHVLLSLIHYEIKEHVNQENWDRFIFEITNCVENEIQVMKFSDSFNKDLSNTSSKSNDQSLIEYIKESYSVSKQLVFFEMWASKGHPYHPCHKTRLGFDKLDYIKYSPEFNEDIEIPLAAIDKTLLHIEQEEDSESYDQWFSKKYPEQWDKFQRKLLEDELSKDAYHPIFVHPWQYKQVLVTLFDSLITDKKLILFNDITITTKASLSFRTLMVKDSYNAPHIKLPVAVHSTSALRIISPASIENSPKLSKILRNVMKNENEFDGHLKIAYESYSLRIKGDNLDNVKHLAIIYRDNPSTFITKKQMPIVVAALYETSPITKTSLFIEIIKAAGNKTLEQAIDYFDKYCKVVIQAYLDLFLIYGIALEGHQQNTIAIFENFQPICMIARDLGGLRIHKSTLESKGYYFNPFPNSATICQESHDVTNKFLHTVIQSHLGEIVLLLAQHYQESENIFWKIIKSNLVKRFNELKNRVETFRWKQEYNTILEKDWKIKSLLRMRLNNLNHNYIYTSLKNPLRDL